MQAYESIEYGNTIDALTDLTGGICELFQPDINPPDNLFHILYKSSVNRSFMVCWRNGKIPTSTGFYQSNINGDVRFFFYIIIKIRGLHDKCYNIFK